MLVDFDGRIVTTDSPPDPDQHEGYWIDNSGNQTIFSISGTEFNSPSWKNQAVEVFIPEGITSISPNALSGLNNLTTVSLPTTLESIHPTSFENSENLNNIYLYGDIPPEITTLGNNVGDFKLQIKVESDSFDNYRLASGWSQYFNQLFVLNDLIPGSRVHSGYTQATQNIIINDQADVIIEGLLFNENTEIIEDPGNPNYNWNRAIIQVYNSQNIIIRNCRFEGLSTRAFTISGCNNITIYNCDILDCWNVATVVNSKGNIRIFSCDIRNIQGQSCTERAVKGNSYGWQFANAVQFQGVGDPDNPNALPMSTAEGNRVQDLAIENYFGYAEPEDIFSNYRSWHSITNPYIIRNNWIRGGSTRTWGVVAQLNDNGGSGVLVENNIAVNGAQGGLSVCGGHDVTIRNNTLLYDLPGLPSYMKALQSWIYRPDVYPVNNRYVGNNRVKWSDQSDSRTWSGTPQAPDGWDTNINRDESLNSSILPEHILGIRKGGLLPIDPFIPEPQPSMSGSIVLTNNQTVNFDETATWIFRRFSSVFYLSNVKEMIVPEGITHFLGKSLTNSANVIQKLTLPSTLEHFGENTLENCVNFNTIVCKAIIPPVFYDQVNATSGQALTNVNNIISNTTLYVPPQSVSAYQNSRWGGVNSKHPSFIIEADPDFL